MSAFLGKIHYLLYNKIQLHEDILELILNFAEEKNLPVEEIKDRVYKNYGHPERRNLEDVIDVGNIHGWLHSTIQSVEGRTAAVITELVGEYGVGIKDIEDIYFNHGKKIMKTIEKQEFSPSDLFGLIFNYQLEGMPCDRINKLIANDDTEICWLTTTCIHKEHWDKVSGNVENFYILRDAWIRGFISELDEKYTYERDEKGYNRIRKVIA